MSERRTIVTAFSPPAGLTGTSGLFCALSADASTLEALLSEFTGDGKPQRQIRGKATLTLALDRRSAPRDLRAVPGLCVAEPVLASWPEGSMLHAKIALLGFSRDPLGDPEVVRLVVSTGNWTAASLSEHIDMLWLVDLHLGSGGQDAIRADVAAAAGFLQDLLRGPRKLFQALPPTDGDGLLATCLAMGAGGGSRFIHSMKAPLIGQIGARFVPTGSLWNWIYAGSGFFEQAGEADPVVLEKVEAQFKGKTTRRPRKWVVINLGCPGAFAKGPPEGWTVCEPSVDEKRTFMHAKFIAAGRRSGARHHDVAVYLGSGNLSKAGLLTALGSAPRSRIEAGVVFGAGSVEDDAIWSLLPNSEEIDAERLSTLVDRSGEPDPPPIPPPPILYAKVVDRGAGRRKLRLHKADPEGASQVGSRDGVIDVPIGTMEIDADDAGDAYLDVRTTPSDAWQAVPVIGADGSFARVRTRPVAAEEVLEALSAFPRLPEILMDADEPGLGIPVAFAPGGRPEAASSYPARDAMRIIEEVARLASAAAAGPPGMVAATVRSLTRILIEGLRDEDKAAFAALGVDFTATLKEMPGMPEEEVWTRLVDAVAADWGLRGMPTLSLEASRVAGRT